MFRRLWNSITKYIKKPANINNSILDDNVESYILYSITSDNKLLIDVHASDFQASGQEGLDRFTSLFASVITGKLIPTTASAVKEGFANNNDIAVYDQIMKDIIASELYSPTQDSMQDVDLDDDSDEPFISPLAALDP